MSELEKCCGLVIAAGLATGHADTHIDLMEEVLAQCINAGPNVRAQAERIAELEAEIERLKGGIEKWLREGVNKYDTCPHGKMWYEGCEACDESYFAALIAPQEQSK